MAPSGSGIIGGFGAEAGAAGRQRPFPARRHVAVQLVVFDQRYPAHFQTPPPRTGQEACPTSRPAGKRIEKREPLPGSLSTVISPPTIWQNLADRQTQTGAVVPPGGGAVHLRRAGTACPSAPGRSRCRYRRRALRSTRYRSEERRV